jgi:hypothetical protein
MLKDAMSHLVSRAFIVGLIGISHVLFSVSTYGQGRLMRKIQGNWISYDVYESIHNSDTITFFTAEGKPYPTGETTALTILRNCWSAKRYHFNGFENEYEQPFESYFFSGEDNIVLLKKPGKRRIVLFSDTNDQLPTCQVISCNHDELSLVVLNSKTDGLNVQKKIAGHCEKLMKLADAAMANADYLKALDSYMRLCTLNREYCPGEKIEQCRKYLKL